MLLACLIVGGQGLLVARKETPEDGGLGRGGGGGSQWKGGRVKDVWVSPKLCQASPQM